MRIGFSFCLVPSVETLFVGGRFSVLLLSVLFVLCGGASAQEFKQMHPGVEHARVAHKIGADPVKINLLRLDLSKVRLDVHHALDKAIGLETTSSIAKRKGAVAAINAGFFRLDRSEFAGDAAGVLMIDQKLVSESFNDRSALFISNGRKTNVDIARISVGALMKFGKKEIPISGINREAKPNEIVIFDSTFGRNVLPREGGVNITVDKGKILQIQTSSHATAIPSNGHVITATGRMGEMINNSGLKVGDGARLANRLFSTNEVISDNEKLRIREAKKIFENAEDITNGVSTLIKDGVIGLTWEQERASRSFAETRHPRTAVAKMKDGKFLMVTVDGRQPGVSVGMSLQELAEYLLSLGAVDAMNLDGGGSTTMYLDGKVVNTPSDKEGERKIGDAIVVTLRKK